MDIRSTGRKVKVQVSFISALDRLFNRSKQYAVRSKQYAARSMQVVTRHNIFCRLFFVLLLLTAYCLLPTFCNAEVLERIVAIVNNKVILLSEYEEALEAARKSDQKVTEDVVLDEMINRILILEQAKRLSLGSTSDSAENVDDYKLINEYIERRIKALIHIPIDEIESYYKNNRGRFAEKEFYEVKDEIEDYMVEGELKRKIAEHVEELRKKAYIRIQLGNGDKNHQVK